MWRVRFQRLFDLGGPARDRPSLQRFPQRCSMRWFFLSLSHGKAGLLVFSLRRKLRNQVSPC